MRSPPKLKIRPFLMAAMNLCINKHDSVILFFLQEFVGMINGKMLLCRNSFIILILIKTHLKWKFFVHRNLSCIQKTFKIMHRQWRSQDLVLRGQIISNSWTARAFSARRTGSMGCKKYFNNISKKKVNYSERKSLKTTC